MIFSSCKVKVTQLFIPWLDISCKCPENVLKMSWNWKCPCHGKTLKSLDKVSCPDIFKLVWWRYMYVGPYAILNKILAFFNCSVFLNSSDLHQTGVHAKNCETVRLFHLNYGIFWCCKDMFWIYLVSWDMAINIQEQTQQTPP